MNASAGEGDVHGASWELLLAHEGQIKRWIAGSDLVSIAKIEELLVRQGVKVPYRTVHRFAGAGRPARAEGDQ